MAAELVEEIFEFWRQCSGHHRARLDDKRVKEIIRALRWRYSAEDIKLAILGCCTNPWYGGGQNERRTVYNHIGLILRDADHLDRFMKDGEQEIQRSWSRALEEDERRRPKQGIPEESRRKIGEVLKLAKRHAS